MFILFDHVTPRGVAQALVGHAVVRAVDRGWNTLSNGELLQAAEEAGFDVVVTADKTMRYNKTLRVAGLRWWFSARPNGPSSSSISTRLRPP